MARRRLVFLFPPKKAPRTAPLPPSKREVSRKGRWTQLPQSRLRSTAPFKEGAEGCDRGRRGTKKVPPRNRTGESLQSWYSVVCRAESRLASAAAMRSTARPLPASGPMPPVASSRKPADFRLTKALPVCTPLRCVPQGTCSVFRSGFGGGEGISRLHVVYAG